MRVLCGEAEPPDTARVRVSGDGLPARRAELKATALMELRVRVCVCGALARCWTSSSVASFKRHSPSAWHWLAALKDGFGDSVAVRRRPWVQRAHGVATSQSPSIWRGLCKGGQKARWVVSGMCAGGRNACLYVHVCVCGRTLAARSSSNTCCWCTLPTMAEVRGDIMASAGRLHDKRAMTKEGEREGRVSLH